MRVGRPEWTRDRNEDGFHPSRMEAERRGPGGARPNYNYNYEAPFFRALGTIFGPTCRFAPQLLVTIAVSIDFASRRMGVEWVPVRGHFAPLQSDSAT